MASEAMVAVSAGLRTLKFYPARAAGGTAVLADFVSIFKGVLFVPRGKVAAADVPEYLPLANVIAVGACFEGSGLLVSCPAARRFGKEQDIWTALFYIRSTTSAIPCPTPMHIDARPIDLPWRRRL